MANIAPTTPWKRLIRFIDADDGTEKFGEPQIENDTELLEKLEAGTLETTIFTGSGSGPVAATEKGKAVKVRAISELLKPEDVPIIKCIGLNYIKHIKEGGRTPPPFPSVFIKPAESIAKYNEDVPIPEIAQDGTVDYEGELAIVIGKTGRNIPKEHALSHIAGYTVSNDVSARGWQRDPKKAGGVPQWCFSKGFDKYCPVGPMLVSPAVLQSANDLRLQTWVNGELRQDESTGDMLFGVEEIIEFVSKGSTLKAGTVILTGTPSGVGMGIGKYLADGDVVEVKIEGLGSVRNKMVFEGRGGIYLLKTAEVENKEHINC